MFRVNYIKTINSERVKNISLKLTSKTYMLHIQIVQSDIFELRGAPFEEKNDEIGSFEAHNRPFSSYIQPNGMIESS